MLVTLCYVRHVTLHYATLRYVTLVTDYVMLVMFLVTLRDILLRYAILR